ncbi:MAG: helix-turn-helix domain-containing protein [Actinomycetota bacterium]|nr:helix-turn-helix domain-containing protein [Actinomycetota bacterium]
MTDFLERRAQFGATLRRLRAAKTSSRGMAKLVDWPQSRVSKIETGAQTAHAEDVRAWCDALDVGDGTTRQLLAELEELVVEQAAWRSELRRGHRQRQDEITATEQTVTRIRAVEMLAIPGLLQTPAYARAIFDTQARLHDVQLDTDEAIASRIRRQQVLDDPGRSFEFLVGESALLHHVCDPDTMAEQIQHLAAIDQPNIRLGLIPAGIRLPFVVTNGFLIHDDKLILVDTLASELRIADPDQIAAHHRMIDALWTVAVEGERARTILEET